MTATATNPRPPRVGPYGRREWLPAESRWRVYLAGDCPEGHKLIADYLDAHPAPALVVKAFSRRLHAALARDGAGDPDHPVHTVAVTAVVRAATLWSPDFACGFATLAARFVYRRCQTHYGETVRRRGRGEVAGVDLGWAADPRGGDGARAADVRDALDRAFRGATERERAMLGMAYGYAGGAGVGVGETARRYGLSVSRVVAVVGRAIGRAREELGVVGVATRRVAGDGPRAADAGRRSKSDAGGDPVAEPECGGRSICPRHAMRLATDTQEVNATL